MDQGISPGDRKWLESQIAEWEKSPAVTPDQLAELKARFGSSIESKHHPANRVMTFLSVMGALLAGAGVILFIASNWKSIPVYIQLALIFSMIIAVNHGGYRLRYDGGKYPKAGAGLLLLGSSLFGAGIWLVAQVYNITTMTNTGVLVWALGTLPAGLILCIESITVFSNALLLTWALMMNFDFGEPRHEYLLLTILVYLPAIYFHKSPKALMITLIGLVVWLSFTLGESNAAGETFFLIYMAFGSFSYLAGLWHNQNEKWDVFSPSYRLVGVFLMFMAAYVLGFKELSLELVKSVPYTKIPGVYWIFSALFIAGSFTAIIITDLYSKAHARPRKIVERMELILPLILSFAPLMALGNPGFVFNALLFNAVSLILAVGLVSAAAMRRENGFVNLGFLMFALLFVTRYFEWVYEYFSKSLFFIFSGVTLLLLAAYMERTRRKVIESMRRDDEQKA